VPIAVIVQLQVVTRISIIVCDLILEELLVGTPLGFLEYWHVYGEFSAGIFKFLQVFYVS
jgi:hypothetical protein